ncbi:MAG: TetR/AcrR family transcriptional regulator [Myxococcota bacterium]
MGRPPLDPDRPATPARILTSALRIFARDGYAAARLADIAKGAEVTRPSLLYHFRSKQVLYEAVVRGSFARVGAALAQAMVEPAPFPERLRRVAETYARELANQPEDARIVVSEMMGAEGPGLLILLDEVTPLLDRVVAFVETAEPAMLRPGLDIRAAVLQVASDVLLQHAATPPVQKAMWGTPSPARTALLTAQLFLAEEVA